MSHCFRGSDIAHQTGLAFFCTGNAVDADVDDHRSRLDPVALHHFGHAHRRNHNVRPVNDRSEIARAAMRQGNGAVFLEQKLRHRLAHAIGAAHDNGRSEEPPSELQSLMRTSYAVFYLKKQNISKPNTSSNFTTY